MIELKDDKLEISFPGIHRKAKATVSFLKTLRIPDDNKTYPLPAGLGEMQLRHFEEYKKKMASHYSKRGGVILPMYQSEAMWINFDGEYPMAIKIATGKVNAITGFPLENVLSDEPQDYMVIPEQPWLDGYKVSEQEVRQFVATRQGCGESAEEQITGNAEFGGIQLIVIPMRADVYHSIFERKKVEPDVEMHMCYHNQDSPLMGFMAGGMISQTIEEDPYGIDAWDTENASRCFVHTIDATQWHKLTGEDMPRLPITAAEYEEQGMPWFEYYDEKAIHLSGSKVLSKLKSYGHFNTLKKDEVVNVSTPISLSKVAKCVSEGEF